MDINGDIGRGNSRVFEKPNEKFKGGFEPNINQVGRPEDGS